DEQVLHQPAVFCGSGLEFRHRAEIDQRGSDGLSARDAVEGFFWSKANPDVLDIDDGAVVHLKRVLCFQLGEAIGADHLEIGAAGSRARAIPPCAAAAKAPTTETGSGSPAGPGRSRRRG